MNWRIQDRCNLIDLSAIIVAATLIEPRDGFTTMAGTFSLAMFGAALITAIIKTFLKEGDPA